MLGPRHQEVLQTEGELGVIERRLGCLGSADEHLEGAFAKTRERFGAAHEKSRLALNNLVVTLVSKVAAEIDDERKELELGRLEGLLELYRAAEREIGPNFQPSDALIRHSVADLCLHLGRVADAERLYEEALELAPRIWPEGGWMGAVIQAGFAARLEGKGELRRAEELLEESVQVVRETRGASDPTTRALEGRLESLRLRLAAAEDRRGGAARAPVEAVDSSAVSCRTRRSGRRRRGSPRGGDEAQQAAPGLLGKALHERAPGLGVRGGGRVREGGPGGGGGFTEPGKRIRTRRREELPPPAIAPIRHKSAVRSSRKEPGRIATDLPTLRDRRSPVLKLVPRRGRPGPSAGRLGLRRVR